MYYEMKNYRSAMADLDHVLEIEPGNALTLYNRSLIKAQLSDFEGALDDMDRVININPGNVLAYFNRASYLIELHRYSSAVRDYDKAIELYPDFAKAYLGRSYAKKLLGRNAESKMDYTTAQQKIKEYRDNDQSSAFADTTKKFNSLLALDADFAKKDFDNELLQHRDIDIRLRPLYCFELSSERETGSVALSRRYENPLVDRFIGSIAYPIRISNEGSNAAEDPSISVSGGALGPGEIYFIQGLRYLKDRQFTKAIAQFDHACNAAADPESRDKYSKYYNAFYLLNRGVLRARMIEFIASIENNVQTLSMDDKGAARTKLSDSAEHSYDYSEAIADICAAICILPELPYLHFNLGNLHCLDSQPVNAIADYTRAIELYPHMGDAYYNRGLVQIFIKETEKGCIDLSRAGELGVADAYSVIAKYCKDESGN